MSVTIVFPFGNCNSRLVSTSFSAPTGCPEHPLEDHRLAPIPSI